jgi:hypothetical protein
MQRTDGSAKEKDFAPKAALSPGTVEGRKDYRGSLHQLLAAYQTAPGVHGLRILPGKAGSQAG